MPLLIWNQKVKRRKLCFKKNKQKTKTFILLTVQWQRIFKHFKPQPIYRSFCISDLVWVGFLGGCLFLVVVFCERGVAVGFFCLGFFVVIVVWFGCILVWLFYVCHIRIASQSSNKLLFNKGHSQHLDNSSEKLRRISKLGRVIEQTAFPSQKKKTNKNPTHFLLPRILSFTRTKLIAIIIDFQHRKKKKSTK